MSFASAAKTYHYHHQAFVNEATLRYSTTPASAIYVITFGVFLC